VRHAVPLLLLLAACADAPPLRTAEGFAGAEVSPPRPMPSVTLVNARGDSVALPSLVGDGVTLLFFGYMNCPDICPVHLANIAAVLHKLPDEVQREVRVVFVTTDPERDTFPRLEQWVRGFDRRFVALTGDTAQIHAAERALGLGIEVRDSSVTVAGAYALQHASQIIAFTRDGLARVQYPFGTRQRDWAADLPLLLAHGADDAELRLDRLAVRAAPVAATVAGVYFTLALGDDAAPDTLVAVASPEAERSAMHGAGMTPMAALPIAPGGVVRFMPGGAHGMLTRASGIAPGDSLTITLRFASGRVLTRRVAVTPVGSDD
jgi:protein SCO1